MRERLKKRLGELLIENGILTKENLEEALIYQKKNGGVIGQILIRLGYISEENLVAALGHQLNVPYLPLQNYSLNMDVVRQLEEEFCKRNMVIAFDRDAKYIYLSLADPLNVNAIEEIEKLSQMRAQIFISTPSEILNMLDLVFTTNKKEMKKVA